MEPEEQLTATLEATLDTTEGLNHNMQEYLSYRACGFSHREACKLAKISEAAVWKWRQKSPEFNSIMSDIKGLVSNYSQKYLEIEFLRNYRLILRKDYEIIQKSLEYPEFMTREENNYLAKIRPHYTPEQLDILKKLSITEGNNFNFTELVLKFAEAKLKVEPKIKSVPLLEDNNEEERQT